MTPHRKIYLAAGAVFVGVLAVWIATLPFTFSHIKNNTAARPVDPALAEVRARIKEFRTQLQRFPSFPAPASAAIPASVIQSLEAKLKVSASSSRK